MSAVWVYPIKPGSLVNPWQSWQAIKWNKSCITYSINQEIKDNCGEILIVIIHSCQSQRCSNESQTCWSFLGLSKLPPTGPTPSSSFVSKLFSCLLPPLLIVFILLIPLSGRRGDLMSLPWSSNLQIGRQTHLQMCKADESAAKEKVI